MAGGKLLILANQLLLDVEFVKSFYKYSKSITTVANICSCAFPKRLHIACAGCKIGKFDRTLLHISASSFEAIRSVCVLVNLTAPPVLDNLEKASQFTGYYNTYMPSYAC